MDLTLVPGGAQAGAIARRAGGSAGNASGLPSHRGGKAARMRGGRLSGELDGGAGAEGEVVLHALVAAGFLDDQAGVRLREFPVKWVCSALGTAAGTGRT
jgi:hypothetical protein